MMLPHTYFLFSIVNKQILLLLTLLEEETKHKGLNQIDIYFIIH